MEDLAAASECNSQLRLTNDPQRTTLRSGVVIPDLAAFDAGRDAAVGNHPPVGGQAHSTGMRSVAGSSSAEFKPCRSAAARGVAGIFHQTLPAERERR
jgi:hypothetical protein